MADNTKIEWTDATWNPVNGCSLASPGCTNCYAMKQAHRVPQRRGMTRHTSGGMVWTGEVRFDEAKLTQPLHWKRPRKIFVCAHGDLFHDAVPDEWIDRVFAVMALCPQHTFQVLTKRADRMRGYVTSRVALQGNIGGCAVGIALAHGKQVFGGITTTYPAKSAEARELVIDRVHNILPNVWLGVSVEDQRRALERIPDLLATPAAVRWLSCEPLLEEISLRDDSWSTDWMQEPGLPGIDWVVAGGESGPGARPMHPDWARTLRDQCAAAGVPFFFKQWGEYAPGEIAGDFLNPERAAKGMNYFNGHWSECWSEVDGHCDDEPDVYRVGKRAAGRLLDGIEHNAMPGGFA